MRFHRIINSINYCVNTIRNFFQNAPKEELEESNPKSFRNFLKRKEDQYQVKGTIVGKEGYSFTEDFEFNIITPSKEVRKLELEEIISFQGKVKGYKLKEKSKEKIKRIKEELNHPPYKHNYVDIVQIVPYKGYKEREDITPIFVDSTDLEQILPCTTSKTKAKYH